MTAQELARRPANEIRRNEKLMSLYIELYKGLFSFEPNCAGCTFSSDFKRFRKAVLYGNNTTTTKNRKTMANQDFELKRQHRNRILTYRKNNRPYRSYGDRLTNDFVRNFLSEGTPEQIEERKALFNRLPSDTGTAEASNDSGGGEGTQETQNDGRTAENAQNGETDEAAEIADLNLDELESRLQEVNDLQLIDRIEAEENREKPRKGALGLIQERRREIEEENAKA